MENGETFKLTTEEDLQFGVPLNNGQLRFGPNGSRLSSATGTAVTGLAIAGFMILVGNSSDMKFNGYNVVNATPVRLLGIAIVTYTSFYAWNVHRSGVVANASGLQLRQGRHCVNLPWSSVHAIDAHNQDDDETATNSFCTSSTEGGCCSGCDGGDANFATFLPTRPQRSPWFSDARMIA